jgi:hypothetical protein
VVPAGEGAAFEVIQSEFALEIFVHTLGPPEFFAEAHNLFAAHSATERSQEELTGRVLAIEPFGDQPEWLVCGERRTVILGTLTRVKQKREPSLELLPSRQVSLRNALEPRRPTN